MSKFFSSLNIRLILIHLVALWFFFYAFQSYAFLKDRAFAEPTLNGLIKAAQKPRYDIDKTFIEQMGNIGLLVAYVISWYISTKRGWHWINGVIAFLIAFALGSFNWFGWDHLSGIFLAPGRLFGQTSVWNFLVSGTILLIPGLLLLFWKKIQLFIGRGNYVDKTAIEEEKKKRRVR
jgi:hypothetical protein